MSSSLVSDKQIMSMSFREAKCESSSSRQRDVIELIFTCETVMSVSPCSGWLDDVDRCDECSADPTEDARRTESGNGDIVITRQAAAAQQWVSTKHQYC